MMRVLVRLALSGMRSRMLASALTVLISASAVATIVLALEVRDTGRAPWDRTFAAANGAHVLATVPTEAQARALRSLPGVAQSGAPLPQSLVQLQTVDSQVMLRVVGLSGRPNVNVPVATTGTDSPGDGAVVEQSLAAALGLRVGDRMRVSGDEGDLTLPIVGTAVVPSQARYPRSNPGVAWVGRGTLLRLRSDPGQWRWTEALRLADPGSARAVADSILAGGPPGSIDAVTGEDQRDLALEDAAPLQLILTMFTMLLLGVVFAVVAILVGARALEQYREIGLLKSVGLSPRQVSSVFVIESVTLGLIASLLGFITGALLAPRLAAAASQAMLGSPTLVAQPRDMLLAAAPVVLVLAISAWLSTRRRTRFSVLHALSVGRSAPPARSLPAGLLRLLRSSVPLALGMRTILAGRGRAFLLTVAITLTGAALVFALSMQASLADRPAGVPSDVPTELPVLVYALDVVLLVITATALLAIALLALRERLRDFGVLKTLGLTPGQVASTLVSPYAVLATVAGVVSVPLGVGLYVALYKVSGGEGDPTIAPWPWLVVIPMTTVLLVVAATTIPARIAMHAPTVGALRTE